MQGTIANVFWRIQEEAGGFLAPQCLTLPDCNGSFSSFISLHSLVGQVHENYSLSAIKEGRTLFWWRAQTRGSDGSELESLTFHCYMILGKLFNCPSLWMMMMIMASSSLVILAHGFKHHPYVTDATIHVSITNLIPILHMSPFPIPYLYLDTALQYNIEHT